MGVAGHHEHVEISVLPEASIPSVPEVARTQLSLPSCPHVIGAAGVSCLKAQSPGPVRSQILGWHLGLSFAAVSLILPPPAPAPRDRARPLWGRPGARAALILGVGITHQPHSRPVQSPSQAELDTPIILDQGSLLWGETSASHSLPPERGHFSRARSSSGHSRTQGCW